MSFIFDPSTVAIATTTSYPRWYRGRLRSLKHTDKMRGDLGLELIKAAVEKGYRIVVADWQSSRSFRRMVSSVKNAIIIKRRSLKPSPSRRQAIKKASRLDGVAVIMITEPEKTSLVTDCLPTIIQPLLQKNAEIVVPKRNPQLFKETYPLYQYESEQGGNIIYNEALRAHGLLDQNGLDFDLFFGPCAFLNTKRVLKLFMKQYRLTLNNVSSLPDHFNDEPYSNTRNFPIIMGLAKKIRIASVEVAFSYPRLQKLSEEKSLKEVFIQKRKLQKTLLLIELLHFISFLEKNPGSRIKTN